MLTYLTMWVLFQKPAKATHNNPFLADKCTAKQIAELLSKDSNEEYPVSFESFQNVFDENDRVMVCKSYRNWTELKSFDGDIIMIVFDVNSSSSLVLKDSFSEWELWFIRVTNESLRVLNKNCWAGQIYVWHGKLHTGFWKIQRDKNLWSKCIENANELLNLLQATWNVLVFVKNRDPRITGWTNKSLL